MTPWFKVNESEIKEDIIESWEILLNDTTQKEESYQNYLSKHCGFFFPKNNDLREQVIVEKLKFGADYISDFVVCENQRSYGFQYTLIEIESPHTPPFTKDGKQSARLRDAIQQIHDWQHWIEGNIEEAKRIFPSKEFIVGNISNFKYIIVIGRKENTEENLFKRNFLSNKINIEIRSFDFFTELAQSRKLFSFTDITQDLIGPTEEQNNEFSNPFFLPYPDKDWRKITKSPQLVVSHMVGHNIKLLLKSRKYNDDLVLKFEDFLTTNGYSDIEEWEYKIFLH